MKLWSKAFWDRNTKHVLICYITAVLIRLAFVSIFPGPNYFGGVSERCLDVAKNVVEGRGYVFYVNIAPFGQPDHYSYEPFIDKPIGYPTFLAVIFFLFGYSPVIAQIIQTLIISLGVIFIYKIILLLGLDERYAFGGALLSAVFPNHARFEVTILPEAVMPFLLILTCYYIIKSLKFLCGGLNKANAKSVLKSSLTAGLFLGIGALSRPDVIFLPFFLFILFWIVYGLPKTSKVIVPLSIVFYSIIGIHTIRNYLLTNEIIPLGYSNGTVVWQGISQFGDTLGTVYSDYRIAHHEGYPSLLYPNGIERDRKRFKEGISIIKEHPFFFLSLIPRRIPLLLVPRGLLVQDDPAPKTNDREDFPQKFRTGFVQELTSTPLRASIKIFSALSGVFLLVLASVGFFRNAGKNKLIIPLGIMALYFMVVLLPINSEARYFFPAVVFLFPLSMLVLLKKDVLT